MAHVQLAAAKVRKKKKKKKDPHAHNCSSKQQAADNQLTHVDGNCLQRSELEVRWRSGNATPRTYHEFDINPVS